MQKILLIVLNMCLYSCVKKPCLDSDAINFGSDNSKCQFYAERLEGVYDVTDSIFSNTVTGTSFDTSIYSIEIVHVERNTVELKGILQCSQSIKLQVDTSFITYTTSDYCDRSLQIIFSFRSDSLFHNAWHSNNQGINRRWGVGIKRR